MSKVEVLTATMYQKNFDKIREMNIQSDVLFANQDDKYEYTEMGFNNCYKARMITTPDRGVGKNRNKALLYAEGEILLFSDEDIVYNSDYCVEIEKAYESLPDADVIIFSCNLIKNNKIFYVVKNKTKRLHLFNALKYGTYVVSIRRNSLLKANIFFSQLFGGGCRYLAGEDSLFIRECFRKKLKIYSHEYILGNCSKDSSTWFTGYHKKYFYDKGVLYAALFPTLSLMMCFYFLLRHREQANQIGLISAYKEMLEGIKEWKNKDAKYNN